MRKVSKLKESRGRVRFLEEEELARLLQACKESTSAYLYPVVLIALSTGMRYGEINAPQLERCRLWSQAHYFT